MLTMSLLTLTLVAPGTHFWLTPIHLGGMSYPADQRYDSPIHSSEKVKYMAHTAKRLLPIALFLMVVVTQSFAMDLWHPGRSSSPNTHHATRHHIPKHKSEHFKNQHSSVNNKKHWWKP